MSNLTGTSVTPQPFRNPNSTDKVARNSQESEKWDDLVSIIYSESGTSSTGLGVNQTTTLTSLKVPCPVPLRLELHGTWNPIVNNTAGGESVFLFFNIAALKSGAANAGNAAGFGSSYGPGGIQSQPQVAALSSYDITVPGLYEISLMGQTGSVPAGSVTIEEFSLLVRRGLRPPT